ncbi:HAD-like domain-containing protein [Pavlovales sp. CCMP2436]|nr:HAD-like domain-containing protein [Pavlovales sp. CCMP2436]|eukprot:CAMPEP_0179940484 /NCGR_PEP_ID=MMETSP0983-20121128/16330_1 /TAXON_ID=483367 /ORGANISM="non described non described, Strain CCMP 2436" /LENGTH=285 /DNA_ID=CAMNT_0021847167 /DNA_START=149 /DNA_END=1006 /DNA_ORIENTATION=+
MLACLTIASALASVRVRQGAHTMRAGAPARARAAASMGDYDFTLLLDCDGVIAETERDVHRPSFNEAFKLKGIDTEWDVETYGKLLEVGGGKERMKAHWDEVGWPSAYATADEATRWGLCQELHTKKTELFMERINKGDVPFRPRVLATIDDALTHGLDVAVCSTSNEQAVAAIVAKMGPARASKIRIFAGDAVAKKKPAPDIYLLAAEALGTNTNRCIVIEDTNIGLRAAKAAKMACMITKSIYSQGEDFSQADAVYNDLSFIDLDVLQEYVDANHAKHLFGVA